MTLHTAVLAGIAFALVIVACGGSDGPQDEETPTTSVIVDATSTPIDNGSAVSTEQPGERTLVEGECITDAVEIVACSSDAAKHEVIKVFDLDYLGASFPGDGVVGSQAARGCGMGDDGRIVLGTIFFVPNLED